MAVSDPPLPLHEGTPHQATPGRILDAAIDEFVEHGLAGARVDRIAERAGANKQLLYRHFGNKEGLFDAAVKGMATRFNEIRSTLPDTLEDRLPYYFERATDDQQWVRLLLWEALHTGEEPAVNEDERFAHMQKAVDGVRADQAAGILPADLDAGQLFLSFQALAAHPSAFPQMTRFITGMNPTDPAFRAQRAEFLRGLGRYLSAGLPVPKHQDEAMDEAVRTYIDAIPPEHRPLFDRLHRLVLEARPGAAVVLSYKMPTYKLGGRRLHLAAWKHGVSIYGWEEGRDSGFAARHPELKTGKGTIRLRPDDAVTITDEELRDLARAVLDE